MKNGITKLVIASKCLTKTKMISKITMTDSFFTRKLKFYNKILKQNEIK